MSHFLRLIALVLLTVSWQVAWAADIKRFGCKKNRDALCNFPTGENDDQVLEWAHRRKPGTRDYWCYSNYDVHCCPQNQFSAINDTPDKTIVRRLGELSDCRQGGD
ncbi:hypothetical protein Pst134EA_023198 [Puccinia striiformis f. sp. tritici]|uniref:hypothetical protein n=1 Tax=Puccinia striiformis f. sp. tritici TaxID=168172 RepID=UPI0020080FE3|nr:hypothetical protein Pst134EA_023198 [Puccinia striiformis f. sp. tritici]KAH9455747.1 hypothetical protein Pst134EA_023198 [Puccinia striiformis f. sp. tritici]